MIFVGLPVISSRDMHMKSARSIYRKPPRIKAAPDELFRKKPFWGFSDFRIFGFSDFRIFGNFAFGFFLDFGRMSTARLELQDKYDTLSCMLREATNELAEELQRETAELRATNEGLVLDLERLRAELTESRACAVRERGERERYERMNAALVEDALATRGECTYDRGVFAAREAALCTQIVELSGTPNVDEEATSAEDFYKRQISALKSETSKAADALKAVTGAVTSGKRPPKLRKSARPSASGVCKSLAHIWEAIEELMRMPLQEKQEQPQPQPKQPQPVSVASAASALELHKIRVELDETRVERDAARKSLLAGKTLTDSLMYEVKRCAHESLLTARTFSHREALSVAERRAVRAAHALLLYEPSTDPFMCVRNLLLATCPIDAVRVWRVAAHSQIARRIIDALDGEIEDPITLGAYLQALHAHASEIGGSVAKSQVRVACVQGRELGTGDPIVATFLGASKHPLSKRLMDEDDAALLARLAKQRAVLFAHIFKPEHTGAIDT
jgi:hypothetical protein